MKNELKWDEEFLTNNKESIYKFLNIFNMNSYFGLSFIIFILHLILFFFSYFFQRSILTTILYIFVLLLFMFLLINLPDSIYSFFFINVPITSLDKLNNEQVSKLLNYLRNILVILRDFQQSLFINHDIMTISGVLTLISGFILIFKNFPFYLIIHFVIIIIIFFCCYICKLIFPFNL